MTDEPSGLGLLPDDVARQLGGKPKRPGPGRPPKEPDAFAYEMPEPGAGALYVRRGEYDIPDNADWRSEVRWVAANLAVSDPDPATAPSLAAIALLREAKSSSEARKAFWAQQYAKMSPTKAALEDEQERSKDDGRDLADFCDELRETYAGLSAAP